MRWWARGLGVWAGELVAFDDDGLIPLLVRLLNVVRVHMSMPGAWLRYSDLFSSTLLLDVFPPPPCNFPHTLRAYLHFKHHATPRSALRRWLLSPPPMHTL